MLVLTLSFGDAFNQNLENVSLPVILQTLSRGEMLNQTLDNVSLRCKLHISNVVLDVPC